jgi:hypothetical protein
MRPTSEEGKDLSRPERGVPADRRTVREAIENPRNIHLSDSSVRVQQVRSRWIHRPYHPGYVRAAGVLAVFLLIGLGTLALTPQGILRPVKASDALLETMGFLGGLGMGSSTGEFVISPDADLRLFRRLLFQRRIRRQATTIVLMLSSFGGLLYLEGPTGPLLAGIPFLVAWSLGACYYAFTSRVRYCTHCRYVVTFRRFEGRWACTTCGRPLEEGAALPTPEIRAQPERNPDRER